MNAQAGAATGDVIAEKYELVRPLGEGGMGTVYLARHLLTGRRVALKLVSTSDDVVRQRVLREARAMGRLSHPNVVGVLDMGEWNGKVFLVMEYIHGKNLRDHVDGQRFEPADAIALLLPACSGVAAAHQAGILHRDLKPENLFVCTDRDGTAFDTKVLDFGVAKHLDETKADLSLTDSGTIVGTPRYMAAEQVGAEPSLDERTDVYALGLILYELLAGKLPYDTSGLRNIVMAILRGDYEPLHVVQPTVPEELSRVIMVALDGDATKRHPSVIAFAQALEPWSRGVSFVPPRKVHTPETDGPASWLPPPMSPSRRPVDLVTTRDDTPRPAHGAKSATTAVGRFATAATESSAPKAARSVEDADGWRRPAIVLGLLLAIAVGWILLRGTDVDEAPQPAAAGAKPPIAAPPQPAVKPPPPEEPPKAEPAPPPTAAKPELEPPKPVRSDRSLKQRKRNAPQPPRKQVTKSPAAPSVTPTPRPSHPPTDNRDPWAPRPSP